MSMEEEVELRDLVAQTLELNGCLPKLRAQLRANLFLALDEDEKINKQQPLLNNKLKTYLEMPEGQLMFCLVQEFLEYFDLDFTISVYQPESYAGTCYKYEGRQKIINDLGLKATERNLTGPILLELVKIAQTKLKTLEINLTNINGKNMEQEKDSVHSSTQSSVQEETNQHNLSVVKENLLNNRNKEEQKHHLNSNVEKNIKINAQIASNVAPLDSTYTKNEADDDTFNGTSSIEEETVNGTKSSDNVKHSSNVDEEENHSSVSQDTSPESKSEDKIKTPQKCDKLKSKLELSPLQLNKSRGSDILPSLYNKDFKERNKDFDFDIKDDYEEDFMSGSEVEFSLSKVDCPKPLLEELQRSEGSENSVNSTCNLSKNSIPSIENQINMNSNNSDNKVLDNSTVTENIGNYSDFDNVKTTNSDVEFKIYSS